MRLRIEIAPDCDEELVIRAPALTEELQRLERVISDNLSQGGELSLQNGEVECFVPISELLFFESGNGKVQAHTADAMYDCRFKLFELEQLLPARFARASKSCLADTTKVSSITRSLTGASEVCFKGCNKRIFVSRMYYPSFREKISETRSIR